MLFPTWPIPEVLKYQLVYLLRTILMAHSETPYFSKVVKQFFKINDLSNSTNSHRHNFHKENQGNCSFTLEKQHHNNILSNFFQDKISEGTQFVTLYREYEFLKVRRKKEFIFMPLYAITEFSISLNPEYTYKAQRLSQKNLFSILMVRTAAQFLNQNGSNVLPNSLTNQKVKYFQIL